jgi:hypothetical protein
MLIDRVRNLFLWSRFMATGSLFLCAVVAGLLITTYSYAQVRPEELRRDNEEFHLLLPHQEEQPPQSREQRDAGRILRCKLGIGSFWDECEKPPHADFGNQRQPETPGHKQLKPPLTPGRPNAGSQSLRQPLGQSPASPQE